MSKHKKPNRTNIPIRTNNPNKRRPVPRKTFPLWGWILGAVTVLAVIVIAVMLNTPPAATGQTTDISITQAVELRDQGAFILDVREPDEWVNFHIPGSTLIPLGDLPNRLSEVPTGQKIVVVCNSGNRSKPGRDILLQAGFSDVVSMDGGVSGWKAQGLPITTGP